jgi:hypothetical protein
MTKASKARMMITTIPDYCKKRNVTRQFVYEYIRKGKFKHFDMPTFVEINGNKIQIGMQKVLEVPDEFAPKASDLTPIMDETIGDLDDFLNRMTDMPELKELYRQAFALSPDTDKKAAKATFDAKINAHPDRDRLKSAMDEVNIRLIQDMKKLNAFMGDVLKQAQSEYAAVN